MHFIPILAALALPLTPVSSSVIFLKDGSEGGGAGEGGDGHGACLRACRPQKPKCPENMDPVKLGNCWSCCLHQEPWGQVQAQAQTQVIGVLNLDDLEDVGFDL
ncbi:hypothetical protein BDV18DRAFT_158852 [Aspergillus unguis]